VLAPGLRLGWLTAAEYVVEQLALIKQRANLFTEGPGQYALAEFLRRGLFDDHLVRLRGEHARRQQAFQAALKRYMPAKLLKFTTQPGGIFFWCQVHQSVNAREWSQQALAAGVAFSSGEIFYADTVHSQQARFCYTWLSPEKIDQGVKRLAETLRAKSSFAVPEPANIALV
jgi:2-aminoadipate transaminase